MSKEKTKEGKVILDLSELKTVLDSNKKELQSVKIYLNKASVEIDQVNIPEYVTVCDI